MKKIKKNQDPELKLKREAGNIRLRSDFWLPSVCFSREFSPKLCTHYHTHTRGKLFHRHGNLLSYGSVSVCVSEGRRDAGTQGCYKRLNSRMLLLLPPTTTASCISPTHPRHDSTFPRVLHAPLATRHSQSHSANCHPQDHPLSPSPPLVCPLCDPQVQSTGSRHSSFLFIIDCLPTVFMCGWRALFPRTCRMPARVRKL